MRYTLTEQQAMMRLNSMLAYDCEPTLSGDEVAELLRMSRVPDAWALRPNDVGWTPTYDLDYGASVGWEWKAGKAAASTDFQADGRSYSRSQVKTHCEERAAHYARKVIGATTDEGYLSDPVVN